MSDKTLAMRLLDGRKIPYEVFEYPPGERDAVQIAATLGIPAGEVFKTLVVVRQSGKPMLVMIPSDRQLGLKSLAKSVGEKKVKMASHKEAEALTGLQVGGISALALLNRRFDMLLDASATTLESITISAGRRGSQMRLATADLLEITQARLVDVAF
jgi:Cys-tRNA(Pro)/Cys-tRNA(Cys) deacylase